LVAKLTPSWQLGYFASVLFVIFVVILQLGFFVTKQLLDPLTLGRIGGNFEQFRIVLNVLPYDKAFQRASSRSAVSQRLELDRCGIVQIRYDIAADKVDADQDADKAAVGIP
jgi:hypothetical protein